MQSNSRNKFLLAGAFLAFAVVALFLWYSFGKQTEILPVETPVVEVGFREIAIGKSVEGRTLKAYTLDTASSTGPGARRIVFVGGIHGGYEWNSVALAYRVLDYLKANPTLIAPDVSVAIVPNLNPDALYRVTGKEGRFGVADVSEDETLLSSARFNSHGVDLNRNFDCNWQATSTWRSKAVSAGKKPFSEPEALALKNFLLDERPDAVVFWHSQANAVYASQCDKGILPKTLSLMDTYAKASGYKAVKEFDSYVVTGAAEDWLASVGIPAITVELSSHEALDYEKNLAGVKALLK